MPDSLFDYRDEPTPEDHVCPTCNGTGRRDRTATKRPVPRRPETKLATTRPLARRVDPSTSQRAATSVKMRAGSQKALLLAVFARNRFGLTSYEAGVESGLIERPGCCYWHRVSDLVADGLLEQTGTERIAPTGEMQRVLRITAAGQLVAASL